MAKYTDLSDENDYGDYSKISPLIGKDYSSGGNIDNRTTPSRRASFYGNKAISGGSDYKLATNNLNHLALEVTRLSKKILNSTANTVSRTMSGINQDLGVSGSKLTGAALMKISPILGYAVAKMLDSGSFQGVYTRIHKGIKSIFKSVFSWAGIDTSSIKSFLKGIISFPFRLLGSSLMFVAKLPFKLIASAISAFTKTTMWLVKLPWKIMWGGFSAIFKIASIPFNILTGLAKIPFKLLGGILGLHSAGGGGYGARHGLARMSEGELTLPDKKLRETFKPMNDSLISIRKILKATMIILGGLTIGLLGVKGFMSGTFKAAIASTGVGMAVAGGFLLRQWAKTKGGRDKVKAGAESLSEKISESPIGSIFASVFNDEGALGKIRGNISDAAGDLAGMFRESYDNIKSGKADLVINPFTKLSKSEVRGKFNKIVDGMEKALSAVGKSAEGTLQEAYSGAAEAAGPMPKGVFAQAKWLAKLGIGTAMKGAVPLASKGIGASWDLATSALKIPTIGIDAATEEFTKKTQKREEARKKREEVNKKWSGRFSPVDKFFKGWEKGASELPMMGQLMSWAIKAPFKATAGISKGVIKMFGEPIENSFRNVMTDPKVTEKFGKGFFKSFLAVGIPLFMTLFKSPFSLLGKLLGGGGGKLLGGIGVGGLKMGGNMLILSQLAQIAYNPSAYAKRMSGKEKLGTGDTLIAGIGGVISGGSKEGGPWGMIRGMAAGTALGGFPWGTVIGGVAGLVGVQNMIKTKDALVETGSALGIGIYDVIHMKTGVIGGMKSFFATLSSTGSINLAMAAYAAAYIGNVKENTGNVSSKIPTSYAKAHPSLAAALSVGKLESGNDVGMVHWDVDDWSYGANQIHGTAKAKRYVDKYLSGQKIAKMPLRTHKNKAGIEVYNKEDVAAFNKEFKEMSTRAEETRSTMLNTQNQFMGETQYQPMIKSLGDLGMVLDAPPYSLDARLQLMLQSTANNLGDLAPRVIKNALISREHIAGWSPQQITDTIANYKIANVDTIWKKAITSKQSTREEMINRVNQEAGRGTAATGVPGGPSGPSVQQVAKTQTDAVEANAKIVAGATAAINATASNAPTSPVTIVNQNQSVSNSAKTTMPGSANNTVGYSGMARPSLDRIVNAELTTGQ